jgi:hypothetical protein
VGVYYDYLVLVEFFSEHIVLPTSCFLKYGRIFNWVQTKLAYSILSVIANHILLFIKPNIIEELFP